MENNNQLQKVVVAQTPGFVTKAMESLEAMENYAKMLGRSGILPKHFYEEKKTGEYTKEIILDAEGYPKVKTGAVILCVQHGIEIGMSVTQALQQLIPVNGLVTLKGDGAKSRILSSGVCEIWEEQTSGSIEDETYKVTIYSKRTNGMEKSVSFSVQNAIRMGLWITQAMVNQKAGLKHSAWWKIPERMIMYRALGFISRDLYPDVLAGTYLMEEIETESFEQIKTDAGMVVTPAKVENVAAGDDKVMKELSGKSNRRAKPVEPIPSDMSSKTVLVKETPALPSSGPHDNKDGVEDPIAAYVKYVQGLSPAALVAEFSSVAPFTKEEYIAANGSKKAPDIAKLLIALKKNHGVKEVCEQIGVDYNKLFKVQEEEQSVLNTSANEGSKLVTEQYLLSKNLDPEMTATHMGYSSLEDFYSEATEAEVERLL